MCKDTKTYDEKLQKAMEKAKMEYGENSIIEAIEFKDKNNRHIEYTVDKIYRVGRSLLFGVISRTDNGQKFLVDIESIKKMAIYGYINNVVITSDNALKPHKNKIADIKRIKDYEKESISINDSNIVDKLKAIKNEYGFIITVDNTDIECISWLRLVPYGVIFDMGGNVCAVQVQDELGNKELLDINKFLKIASADYNIGKWSPRSETRNFYRALRYAEVDTDVYFKLKEILGEQSTNLFVEHECGDYYRCDMDRIRIEMARILFADIDTEKEEIKKTNVYYAIPRPEKFDTKSMFESALREAKHMDATKFSLDKYVITEVDGLDREAVFDLLLSRYSELHAGSYLKTNKDILNYVIKAINNELAKAEEVKREEVINVIQAYNNGEDVEPLLEKLEFYVENEDYEFKDELHKEYIHSKLASHRANALEVKKYVRLATLKEVAEHFDLSHLIKEEVEEVEAVEAVESTEDIENLITSVLAIEKTNALEELESTIIEEGNIMVIESKPLEVVYLTDDCKNKLEVKIEETSKICTYLIINGECIRIDESEQSHIDYIKHGVDKSKIKKPLKRALMISGNNYDIAQILGELI